MALTKKQLLDRKSGIGGSDVAAILGISEYRTPLDVYNDKISDSVSMDKTEAQEWGDILEPVIVNTYKKKTGFKVDAKNTRIKKGWMHASLDGIVKCNGEEPFILECKTAGIRQIKKWGDEATESIPHEYLVQVAWYCEVSGLKRADVAVLIAGNKFRIYTYLENRMLQDAIVEVCRRFWENNVLAGIPPKPKNGDDIKKLFPESSEGVTVCANEDVISSLNKMSEIQSKIKELEEEEERLKDGLKLFMKDSETLVDESGNKLATYKSSITKRLDTTKIKSENIDLYNKYLKESVVRTLRIS